MLALMVGMVLLLLLLLLLLVVVLLLGWIDCRRSSSSLPSFLRSTTRLWFRFGCTVSAMPTSSKSSTPPP